MPRRHREFLSYFGRTANICTYLSNPGTPEALQNAYNDAVDALVNLRNIHIQIVARYIVMPSRSPPAPHILQRKGTNLATLCSTRQSGKPNDTEDENASMTRQLHGTGGTSVMPFLKRTRDETKAASAYITRK
jgi:indoleamine 2,3-dioxygenase